jgi:hypothetical protein
MKFYFSHGRTAFKYGLIYLGFKKNDCIMMPNYFCDILIDPLNDLGIKPIFYNINRDFTTDWKSLHKKYKKKVKALFFINYFGYEENKKKFHAFCKKRKIFLIEDDCHSITVGRLNKKLVSDIIFYSVKKIIKLAYSGGVLEINPKIYENKLINIKLKKYQIDLFDKFNKFLEINFLSLKRQLKYLFLKIPNYSKFNAIKNIKIRQDFLIDDYSKKIIHKENLNQIKSERLKNYKLWKIFCSKNKLIFPIKRKLNKNIVPWLYPVYIKNKKLRNKILFFGWKNGYSITPWPSLPKKLINKNNRKIWSELICFNTDKAPKNINKIHIT